MMRWVSLVVAVLLLDVSLTFENVWPTPAIRWHGRVSIELAIVVLVMALASRWLRPPSRRIVSVIAAVWTALVLGHYAEVTAPALYGRDINLYWDLRFIPDVVAMMTRVARWWLIVVSAAAVVVALALLYASARWAIR